MHTVRAFATVSSAQSRIVDSTRIRPKACDGDQTECCSEYGDPPFEFGGPMGRTNLRALNVGALAPYDGRKAGDSPSLVALANRGLHFALRFWG